jgi:hypothetical protein
MATAKRKSRRQYQFQPWATPPPRGDWAYIVDEFDVTFAPGWWPYRHHNELRCVRVSPDSEYRAWNNQYLALYPNPDATVTAYLQLWLRRQAMGGKVAYASATIDIRAQRASVNGACPAAVKDQAGIKAQRLLELILTGRSERRIGWERPWTAYDMYLRSIARALVDPAAPAGDPITELAATGVVVPDVVDAIAERRQAALAAHGPGVENQSLLTLQVALAGVQPGAAVHPGWAACIGDSRPNRTREPRNTRRPIENPCK